MPIPKNDIQLNRVIANKLAVRDNVSNRFLKSYENTLKSQYRISLDNIRKDIDKLYAKFGEDGELFWTEYNRFNRKASLEKQIVAELRNLGAGNNGVYRKAIKGQFQDGYYSTQFAHETGMGLAFQFPVLNGEQVQAALLNPVDAIKWSERSSININQLNKKVRETIAQSIIEGNSQQKTVRALRGEFSKVYNSAVRIVRTETHRARQMGNALNYDKTKASFERLGIKRDKKWSATLDARTRPSHGSADGLLANEDGLFQVFGVSTEAPGLTGIAGEDINCRCTAVSEVEGFSPQTRLDNENKVITPYKSFSAWAESRGLSKNIYGQSYLKVAA